MSRVIITTLAYGGWYQRGVARMLNAFHDVSHGYEIQAWVNTLPPGTQRLSRDGVDYTAYGAKAFAVQYAVDCGADIVLWLDASFWPIRHIQPLIDHIEREGYYLCRNGAKAGEWTSDDCYRAFARNGLIRDDPMSVEEISSGCVGLDVRKEGPRDLLSVWKTFSRTAEAIAGPHTAGEPDGRRTGFVSADPRVKGHRHDQSVLSLIANWAGMKNLSERPQFWQYDGQPTTDETLLLCRGM